MSEIELEHFNILGSVNTKYLVVSVFLMFIFDNGIEISCGAPLNLLSFSLPSVTKSPFSVINLTLALVVDVFVSCFLYFTYACLVFIGRNL